MRVDEIQGPGIDVGIIDHLRSWGINSVTEIQERAFATGVANGCSMIVCAPTSSGKTLVGEVAVLSTLRSGRKAIYLVSHKALADQKYEEFRKKFGESSAQPLGSVGLSTGDRDEGEHDPQLLIATYERALGLLLSGQLEPNQSLVIADELQIVGDPSRGPDIESLCALLRQRNVRQLIALTATVENPDDLAAWLKCQLTISQKRDVALHQEIWHEGKGYRVTFGQPHGEELTTDAALPTDVLDAVTYLLRSGRGPVLVFTETRREAIAFAKEFSQGQTRRAEGIAIAEQLDLFSEPTEASEQLRDNAERRVTFHTADLSPQERQVIEQGFIDSKFEVCFATSTLAAGVNFPFKSVLFSKLTFQYGARAGASFPRSEYRNMSGRAGRLGMHDEGFSILLPKNRIELAHANQLVLPENERVISQLVSLSMRRSVLMLIASSLVDRWDALKGFFENTLFWYETGERNPRKLESILNAAKEAVDWLVSTKLVESQEEALIATPLGKATASTGLLPSTAASFVELLEKYGEELEKDFDALIPGMLYWACSSDEFIGKTPTRYLVYPTKQSSGSTAFLSGKKLLQPLDRTNNQLSQCVHALSLYVEGLAERKIAFNTSVSSGALHRLAIDVSWVLDGLHRLSCVPDLNSSQQLGNRIAMLSRRVRWGAPAEVLDVMRVAERHGVPGFGRQRAMALLENGLVTFEDILNTGKEKLLQILRNEHRANMLVDAVFNAIGLGINRVAKAQSRIAKQLGLEEIVEDCNTKLGPDYEAAVVNLLRAETGWVVTLLDDGKRQNVPDILLTLGVMSVVIECKTCTKKPPLIKKEEAFAVLQKGADFDSKIRRITLGKPTFDEHSKLKAQGCPDVTLVEHSVFLEAVLRLHSGRVGAKEFLIWLGTPGVAEIDRLSGKPTYVV